MAGGYDVSPVEPLDVLRLLFEELRDKVRELERPTGTQLSQTVAKLQDLIDGILAQTSINVSGDVTAGGNINVAGDIYTPHGRATPVTTSYVSAWLNGDGRLGATASSVVYKQDFSRPNTDPLVDALLAVSLVRFRYIQAVEELGDKAPWELGAIAEYFVAIGLGEYVFNNADGEPQGINYERLTIPLIAVVQRLHADGRERAARIEALEKRLEAAGL